MGQAKEGKSDEGYLIASWASSGVFRPIEVFWAFDESVYQ